MTAHRRDPRHNRPHAHRAKHRTYAQTGATAGYATDRPPPQAPHECSRYYRSTSRARDKRGAQRYRTGKRPRRG